MLPVTFSIMLPEQTFQPQSHDGFVCDLSERGAMVVLELPENTYRQLLQTTRYCRVGFQDEPGLPDKIIGKAVYIQPVTRPNRMEYRIGLFFEDTPPVVLEQLKVFVDRLLTAQENVKPR
jgi:hypothetical protein